MKWPYILVGAPAGAILAFVVGTRDPAVTVERNGALRQYVASPDPGSHALYHRLRREYYGLASEIVDWMAGDADTCQGVPVRLEAVTE